jgi:hypothetical protein
VQVWEFRFVYLSSVVGRFKFGQKILSYSVPEITLANAPVILGSLTAVAIENGGAGFNQGDIVDVYGQGLSGKARIAAVRDENGKVNFNLVNGVTTLRMNNNAPLTVFTNLSNNNTVQILVLDECGFSDVADLFTTTLPSSLTSFSFSWNSITGSTWPTNAFSNPGLYFVELIRCGLNTTSVDNIINNVYNTTTFTTFIGSIILGPNTDNPSLGDPNQNRSLASDTAYDALIAAGWNITLP